MDVIVGVIVGVTVDTIVYVLMNVKADWPILAIDGIPIGQKHPAQLLPTTCTNCTDHIAATITNDTLGEPGPARLPLKFGEIS